MTDADDTTQPFGVPAEPDTGGARSGPSHGPDWYVDPWNPAQHRYWDGVSWTAQTFPNGPGALDYRSTTAAQEPVGPSAPVGDPPPAPSWASVGPKVGWVPDLPIVEAPPPRKLLGSRLGAVVALGVGLVIGFALALAFGSAVHHRSRSRTALTQPASVPTTQPTDPSAPQPGAAPGPAGPSRLPGPSDPASSVLAGLVVRQGDVGAGTSVRPLGGGTQLDDPTLDLCNATFPSESMRTARLQVVAVDGTGNQVLSTEAVLYRNAAATIQGFSELNAAMRACPTGPVGGPAGETSTTRFNPPPDVAWPATPTVERQAFDFTTTDGLNQAHHDVAVYLRRGRVLEGVYFSSPDGPQPPVAGQTSLAGIVGVFAARIAALPPSTVDG
ncbi:MAG: hypothetical protein NVS3B12_17220 [Acidimicrobiales bacterium]